MITLKTLYEIIHSAEQLSSASPLIKWFKTFVRQVNRFTRGEEFFLDAYMLSRSREFLSSFIYLGSARLTLSLRAVEIFIKELEEGMY